MKTKPQKDITLIQLFDRFATDDKARKHLEGVLWKDGTVCPHCKCNDQMKIAERTANPDKKIRAGLRFCSNCKSQFTVTVGTVFEDSKIPLRKWLIAWYMLCSSKKGISSLQLQRNLEIGSYRTALFMAHRIRHALKETGFAEKLSGIVEVDEVSVGGVYPQAKGTKNVNKTQVVALVQRGGPVRSKVMPTVNGANLKQAVRENVERCSQLHTDLNPAYKGLRWEYEHKTVNHSRDEFSRHEGENVVTTASVESFFSLLKRGVVGTFHHINACIPVKAAFFRYESC
jgi:transposase-like protein